MKINSLLAFLLVASLSAQAQTPRAPRQQRAALSAAARPSAPGDERPGQTLPIRRVILYSNGVAYVERRGPVAGRAEVNLSFKQSQVDDVLKSMVVLDLGEGRVGAVSYNSSAPPSARMADIPFSIGASTAGAAGGLAGVLAQLQGARVAVTTRERTAVGSVLTVEERRTQPAPDRPSVTTHALVISADGGELMSFDLADVRAVKIIDEGARRDVSEFAAASASARRRDAKTITVTSDGAGAREMLVSYTVAAPIWKTTYRVVLDSEGKPFFQGWAIVDNVSEEDWEGVRLSLISGTPISFIQPIQKPFYRYRPVIPMPSDLKLTPQVHEPESGEVGGAGGAGAIGGVVQDPSGSVVPGASVMVTNIANGQTLNLTTDSSGRFQARGLPPGQYNVSFESPGFKRLIMNNVVVNSSRAANANVNLEVANVSETVEITAADAQSAGFQVDGTSGGENSVLIDGQELSSLRQATLQALITGGKSGVEAAAEGGEVGDLFEYQIAQPVTVRRDRSALIPILQTRMEGERVSIYNEATHATRPMSGLKLKNTSNLTLEDGALTVIDGNAYAGEALLERLKPDEERLVSFALDLGTLVTARADEESAPVHTVQIAAGTLYASYYRRSKKTYTVTNQTDRERTVLVEHPFNRARELDAKETPAPDGKSARFYRFRVRVAPHATERLSVVEREPAVETYSVSNINAEQLRVFVSRRFFDEETRARLQNVIDLRARVVEADRRVAAIDRELREIAEDQKRLRENISALNSTAEARQLIARYVSKADQQETRIEQLTRDKHEAAAERQRLQAELEAAVRTLQIKRQL
jgi:hypothetical protein